jgi:hypothetical protein
MRIITCGGGCKLGHCRLADADRVGPTTGPPGPIQVFKLMTTRLRPGSVRAANQF